MNIETFKLGMRRLIAGVSIVTTVADGRRHGLAATAVNSVTGHPPSLLVCVNQSASAHRHIVAEGIFCVNVLSEQQQPIAARFSDPASRDSRFELGDWRELATGAPALAGSLVSFDCEVRQVVDYHSHSIIIGEIVALELWAGSIRPLAYLNGSYQQLAADIELA